MKQKVAVGTIVAKNYLARARVLAGSLRLHHPELTITLLLADEVEGRFDPAGEPFPVVLLHELPIPGLRRLLFRYGRQQVAVAAKPWLLAHLLDEGAPAALLLDPDMLVLDDLGPLLDAVRGHAIVLTPHLLAPLSGAGRVERELAVLRAGAYNGGVLGVSAGSGAFLEWLKRRLLEHCRHAIGEGMHFDQRWLDLVPGAFDDVHILRDHGVNVAYWNLAERPLSGPGEALRAAGRPCRLFHFSGFDPEHPRRASRHAPHLTWEELGRAQPLFERYRTLLEAAGQREAGRWPYAHDRFSDGVEIPGVARELYREAGSPEALGDPFRDEAVRRWLTEPVDEGRSLSRLWEGVHRRRPDLQAAFPDIHGRDREAYLEWTRRAGAADHGVPEALCTVGVAE